MVSKKADESKKSPVRAEANGSAELNARLDEFIQTWSGSAAYEKANAAIFYQQLCAILDVPPPDPTPEDPSNADYCLERRVYERDAEGNVSTQRFIDLYKKGCFVLEAKQGANRSRSVDEITGDITTFTKGIGVRGTNEWSRNMADALRQAERYAKLLPDEWPPIIMVVDVGYVIRVYSDFSGIGKEYLPFPDPARFEIRLEDLYDAQVRDRLRAIWTDPWSIDPNRVGERVTRDVADRLARFARSLESGAQGSKEHSTEEVAEFLMRCLFTMFAEDVGLLPENSFTELLKRARRDFPDKAHHALEALWRDMDQGTEFSATLSDTVRRFNGSLFKNNTALPLNDTQLGLLIEAAQADWSEVEPSIFGTLLERALDPRERHKLGAHFTPRAYVERLVMPTVIEPLRQDWANVQNAVDVHLEDNKPDQAIAELRAFHQKLCEVRVLDPACGSGNFLYVTMEHLKRLEAEVLSELVRLDEKQAMLEVESVTVTPLQFLGIEVNARAAAVAELVIWLGYLQWHIRTRSVEAVPNPVLQQFRSIECRDAVLAWDEKREKVDSKGEAVTRWDGYTMKKSPVTGEDIPDESARVTEYEYVNPRKPAWPKADFIVGNPPFIGKHLLQTELGEGYMEALRTTYAGSVPDAADFVMYWWYLASSLVANGAVKRFGFVTTNSITQIFNRRVVEQFLSNDDNALFFAVRDHPWVSESDGAAVRVAMSAGGNAKRVKGEIFLGAIDGAGDTLRQITTAGSIGANLVSGADVTKATPLKSNEEITSNAMALGAAGFRVKPDSALSRSPIARPLVNGSDILQRSRRLLVLDTSELQSEDAVRRIDASAFNHLIETVKPRREAERKQPHLHRWWQFNRTRPLVQRFRAELDRYILTPETSKHRVFVFVGGDVVPEHPMICIGLDDGFHLGVLSSRVHVTWSLAAGGRLGVGNDPRYNKTVCFDPFPFPDPDDELRAQIRELGDELDAFRKARQAEHAELTLTGMYNVLEKLRSGEELSAKERAIHEKGAISVLRDLHDRLDRAVFAAYGWSTDLDDDALLSNIVELNKTRQAEEARGKVRWLRPDFQAPGDTQQVEASQEGLAISTPKAPAKRDKVTWPKSMPERFAALRSVLEDAPGPMDLATIAAHFKGAGSTKIEPLLESLVALGRARRSDAGFEL